MHAVLNTGCRACGLVDCFALYHKLDSWGHARDTMGLPHSRVISRDGPAPSRERDRLSLCPAQVVRGSFGHDLTRYALRNAARQVHGGVILSRRRFPRRRAPRGLRVRMRAPRISCSTPRSPLVLVPLAPEGLLEGLRLENNEKMLTKCPKSRRKGRVMWETMTKVQRSVSLAALYQAIFRGIEAGAIRY